MNSGTLDFDEFLYLYNTIKTTSKNGFLVEAKRKVDLAAVSGDNGFGIDMNKLNKKAQERSKRKAKNRENNKLKAAQKAELLKLGFSKKNIETLKNLFDSLDTDKSGTIDEDEIKQGLLSTKGVVLTEEEVNNTLTDIRNNAADEGKENGTSPAAETVQTKLELNFRQFVNMCKALQDGKQEKSPGVETKGGTKLLLSMAEQKLILIAERKAAKDEAFRLNKIQAEQQALAKRRTAELRKEQVAKKQNEIREKKAVSRKERATAARQRREQLHAAPPSND